MKWIDVEDEHFVDITYTKDGLYTWRGEVNRFLMVAVPIDSGWDIQQVVINDIRGLQCFYEGEEVEYCWDITDITHWFEVINPKNK